MKNYILLIDNKNTNIELYHRVFPAIYKDYLIAHNNKEALELLNENNIAVILIDSDVPEMHELGIIRTIREEKKWVNIPIILLSDHYLRELYINGEADYGTIDYVLKPIIPEIVEKKVRNYVELFSYRKIRQNNIESAEQTLTKIIKNENLVLNSANDILENVMSLHTIEQAAKYIIDTCVVVGDSSMGVVYDVVDNNVNVLSQKKVAFDFDNESIINDILLKNWEKIITDKSIRIYSNEEFGKKFNVIVPVGISSWLIIPLYYENKIFGLLTLVKKSGQFNDDDVENFEVLSSTIVSVLSRKKIELELQNYKDNLEKKVHERTKELKFKNRQLKIEQREKISAINILNATPIIAFRWKNEPGLPIEYVSDNLEVVTGYSASDLLNGKYTIKDLVHSDDYDRVQNEIRQFSKIRDRAYFRHSPYRVTKKNGSIIWVDERVILLRNEEGVITHFQGVMFDITHNVKSEEEMKRLSTAIDQLASSVLITDIKGNTVYCNPYFTKITGYSFDEIQGKNPRILKSGYTTDEEYEDLWNRISNGKAWKGEFLNIKKDGTEYWEFAVIAPVFDDKGTIINYVALKKDITQQKKIERQLVAKTESLRESEELFRTLSDASFESIFICKDGLCLMQNNTAELMFGYNLEEAALKSMDNWIVPADREKFLKNMNDRNVDSFEVIALRKDGTTFPCEIKARNSDYHGKAVRISSFSDISRRVEAQKQLVESETQYRSFVRDNHSVIIAIDPFNGNIVDSNNASCYFYGYSFEEMLNMSIADISTLNNDEIKEALYQLRNGIKNYFISEHRLSNGNLCDVEIYAGRIRYGNEQVVLCIIHDITDKIRIQKELEIAKQRAEESDKLKTSFLANMSHEIRTPMNAILGFSQLLNMEGLKPQEVSSYVETVNNSGKQLLSLIDDIISISQIEAGIVEVHCKTIEIKTLLVTVYKYFVLTAKDKKLEFKYNNELPPELTSIDTDSHRIQQVLINLLSNAFKFTKEGKVEFGCRLNEGMIEFYVRDTGIGICSKDRDMIFERFMQVDHGHEHLYGGTGIGLSISKAIIEKLNGKIYVVDKNPPGTEFRFTLPVNKAATELVLSDVGSEKNTSGYSLKGVKILIAEDEEYNYELIDIFIKNAGAKSLHAVNGKEAVELCKLHKDIGIVLMDIKMPVMNGIDAAVEIRKTGNNVPILAQTAYAQIGDKEKMLQAGCNDYISKPIQYDVLVEKISELISNKC